MPKLIILRGPPGVGKTTIENGITKLFSLEKIDLDGLMKKIGRGFYRADYGTIIPEKIDEVLKKGKNAIATGIFYKDILNFCSENVKNEHEPVVINLYCSLKELYERNNKRKNKATEKYIKDTFNDLINDEKYLKDRVDTQKLSIKEAIDEVCRKLDDAGLNRV